MVQYDSMAALDIVVTHALGWALVLLFALVLGGQAFDTFVLVPLWSEHPPESVDGWLGTPAANRVPRYFMFAPAASRRLPSCARMWSLDARGRSRLAAWSRGVWCRAPRTRTDLLRAHKPRSWLPPLAVRGRTAGQGAVGGGLVTLELCSLGARFGGSSGVRQCCFVGCFFPTRLWPRRV
jgi:hypothetical protein